LFNRSVQRGKGGRSNGRGNQRTRLISDQRIFPAREKAALHYADLFKQGEHAIDKDEVYDELKKHFSEEEIIELGMLCAQTDGVGKLVKSFNVLSWDDACVLNPKLTQGLAVEAAE